MSNLLCGPATYALSLSIYADIIDILLQLGKCGDKNHIASMAIEIIIKLMDTELKDLADKDRLSSILVCLSNYFLSSKCEENLKRRAIEVVMIFTNRL